MSETFYNIIGGKPVVPPDAAWFESRNPADMRDCLGRFVESGPDAIAQAAESARMAAAEWAGTPAPGRASILTSVVAAIERHGDELARLMTREMGKPLRESQGEIAKALAESRFMIGEAYRLAGETVPSERRQFWTQTVRVPVGPVAAITPWNFPVITPLRKIMPALVCGNPAVLKPSEETPLTALRLVGIMNEAGLPAGVLNIITGGRATGAALVEHPAIRAVTFTGSTAAGRAIAEAAGRRLVRVQAEMGGKNPAVIWEPPDLADAVGQIVSAACACSGQRCTSISRVIVPRADAPAVADALLSEMAALRPGNGMEPETTLGPLITPTHRERVHGFVQRAVAEGAKLLTGGKPLNGGALDHGNFYAPTLLGDVTASMEVAHAEVFGPVLALMPADSFEQALALANDVEYGLTAAIFTRRLDLAGRFVDGIQSGMVHVNHGTAIESHLPFGGVKHSGLGPGSIGATTREFFTDVKTVYLKYA
jgi:acyl-CoA reductase-like NAD-dependent aldehyde dehydrogenase